MDRRAFLGTLATGLLAGPLAAAAQQTGKVYRTGLLSPGPALFLMEPFVADMRDRGWTDGQHFTMERRVTAAKPESATTLASELVGLKVDVIVTVLTGNAVAARRATTHIPIVMATSGYPVEAGLAASLAKPGGNVTGNSIYVGGEVFGKYLELLRTLSPQLTRLGVLWDYLPPSATREEVDLGLGEMNRAAPGLGMTVLAREVRVVADVDRALATFSKESIGALFVSSGPVHGQPEVAARITEFATHRRIPTMSDFAGEFFARGGVMAYSANPAALGRRTAYFVDRILRGSSPGDLPIERPSKFDLTINLRAAKALGLTIPQSLLHRADHVIE